MQYIMKPAINIDTYEVALFDTVKDNVNLDTVRDLATLSSVLQEARAFMGADSFLNPVRGKSEDGKYYLTFLRFTRYGYDNTLDQRHIGQLLASVPSQSGYFNSVWSSSKKVDGTVQTEYSWKYSYNVNAPIPNIFNGANIPTLLVLPRMKVSNSWSNDYDIDYVTTYLRAIQPGINTSYQSNAVAVKTHLPAGATSDWLYPQVPVYLRYIQYLNLIASNTISTQNYLYITQNDSYKNDGLSYLKDWAPSTKIADMPVDEIVIDAGLIWIDDKRMLKLSPADWSSRDSFSPGTRPKFALDRLVKAIPV